MLYRSRDQTLNSFLLMRSWEEGLRQEGSAGIPSLTLGLKEMLLWIVALSRAALVTSSAALPGC